MTLPERMNAKPSKGDKVGMSCNVCGDRFTYVDGVSDWPHHTKVCENCSAYFDELYERKITILRERGFDDKLLTHIVESVNELDEYAAIPTPNQGHHGKQDNYWIINADNKLEDIHVPTNKNQNQTINTDEIESENEKAKRDPLEQLVSVAIPGSSIQTEPGTDTDNI